MKNLKKSLFVLFAALTMLFVPMAHAGDPVIDAAKDRGEVGETIDGYLDTVGSVDPAVKRKVDEINARRRDVYAKLAADQGTSLKDVARITGEKLVLNEQPGRFVYDDSNTWVKK